MFEHVPAASEIDRKLNDAMDNLQNWTHGHIFQRRPDEAMDRVEMERQVIERARVDASFRHVLLADPTLVWMIAVHEGLGIKKASFLSQIQAVRNIEETEQCLSLVLPACHKGCTIPDAAPPPGEREADSCHVCGRIIPTGTAGCQSAEDSPRTIGASMLPRSAIERRMTGRAARDPAFRHALISEPTETYKAYACELCGGLPAYLDGVDVVSVVEESDTVLCFSIPADVANAVLVMHSPHSSPSRAMGGRSRQV